MSALLFLYREALGIQLPWLDSIQRPSSPKRIPSVLTRDEVAALLAALQPQDLSALVARLLYGTGMRLMEGLRLRVKDLEFDRQVIIVRQAKGNKDRVVMLPRSLAPALRAQVLAARAQWEHDRHAQRGGVEVPHALEAKYPRVSERWGWFWVFPSPTSSVDPRTGVEPQHHHGLHPCAQGRGGRHGEPAGCVGDGLTALSDAGNPGHASFFAKYLTPGRF